MNESGFQLYEPLPSLKRYQELFLRTRGHSVTRALQYELLAQTGNLGKVLDVGGGDNAKYHDILEYEAYESVNIDANMKPTWTVETGEKLPCPGDSYDSAISFNTLEHIFDARFVIAEIFKALKPGGVFYASVPFLYPIHAHPDDFFRPTASWWEKALVEAGFGKIAVTPLMWGPFSVGHLCSGAPGPLKALRRHAALLADIAYAKLCYKDAAHFDEKTGNALKNHALGYFIKAQK